jgi:8-oxo-dGTP diphosphatase
VEAQGIDPARYAVSPRTLVFVRRRDRVLLLRRAPDRRVWPGRLNGVGGHVEAGEELSASARREVREETGLTLASLRLAGLLHASEPGAPHGVVVVVFTAEPGPPPDAAPAASAEGELAWYPIDAVPAAELVPDVAALWPRLWPPPGAPAEPFLALVSAAAPGGLAVADAGPLHPEPLSTERTVR